MTRKSGAAHVEAATPADTRLPLVPNRTSAGMKLVGSALNDGRIVSTKGLSRDDYIARLKGRSGE